MNRTELFHQIKKKNSFLCVGLDSDLEKIPSFLLKEKYPVFEFNKRIINATAQFSIAYKPNLAFYECRGANGWTELEKTVDFIRTNYPEMFLIADAKRGDIGNTSKKYAETFFKTFDFDAVTLSPYMGQDTVSPFLDFHDKWVIILALTSNQSASDFQFKADKKNIRLFEEVLTASSSWGNKDNTMYVIGATKASLLVNVRKLVPDHFLLIPGIGVQGGSLEEVAEYGLNKQCGLIVNSSRGIIFAGNTEHFAEASGGKAKEMKDAMETILSDLQNR